jgi:hypothetical protein
MKTLKLVQSNKFLMAGLLFLVTALLMILGRHEEAHGALIANTAIVSLSDQEKEGLNETEQKFLLACKKMVAQVKEEIPHGTITKEEAQVLIDQIKKDIDKTQGDQATDLKGQIKKLEDILKTQGDVLTEIRMGAANVAAAKTLLQVVKDNAEQLKASTQKGKEHTFEIKANTLRSSITSNPNALDIPEIGQLATRQLTVYDIFRKVPVAKDRNGTVRYVDWDKDTIARAAAAIAEGGTFPASTAKWATYTLNLEKIGDSIPLSEEFMYDASAFAAELENFLKVNVAIKVDTDLIAGDGSSPNLNGLLNQIDAFTASASGITDASIYDLIVKVREAITKSYGSKYSPNVALMNITDINKMKLKKDANNNYILPPFQDRNGNVVDGVTVIECNSITANTMVVGDSRYGAIYEEDGVTVQTGFATGDFESDMMTIKARRRLNLLIRKADKTGWLKVTSISAALTTLAT